jgi:cellobiose phosphorylase
LERHYQILRHPKKSLQIAFKSLKTPQINDALFNAFIKSVIHQVNYCAEAKNSSLMLLGVRDAAQMYEASLLWHPQAVRTYIINLLNFLDPSGRMPRQISIPKKQTEVVMDNRAFIDQGQWIISLVYKYLVYTDDFTLLDEPCTYCELIGLNRGRMLAKTSSVYQHLEEIMAFLLANLDQETNCLHTLYGDWNDAVDGLGISRDPKKEFGNGVSAMATYHLYKNLFEFSQIAQAHKKEYQAYLKMRERVLQGIMTHLIVSQGEEKRLIHGWGENRSFYVGSFQDVDLKARHSATSNAFYVISGVYQRHPEMKPHLLKAFSALDSPYGIRTFDHYFDKKDAKAVGRIVNLPPGTAENAATYLHASMFATKALAMMNEGELMFAQLIKLLPLSHQTISTSPFVMPNSYGYNRELGIDGQSMNDWYTGSANTFIKLLVDDIFGLQPQIGSGLKINPLENFPSQSATISLMIKNHLVKMRYRQEGRGHRLIKVNGETITNNLIDLSEYPKHILIEVSD